MINWIADRLWAWKNADALREIDETQAALEAWGKSLDERIEASCGPDWREQAERRFAEHLKGTVTFE